MMNGGDKVAAATPRPAESTPASLAADMTSAIQQAQALRAKGDLDGEMHVISQLMLAQPDDARVVGEYGKLLVQQGRSNDAVQFLRRAVELAPSDWTFYSALGVAYDQLADPVNAKLAYERALALKPGEAAVLNNFGMSRMLAGDAAGARALMVQAKASGSTDPKIDSNLALLDRTSPAPVTAAPAVATVTTVPATHATAVNTVKPVVVSHAATPAVSHVPTPVVSKPIAPVTTAAVSTPTTASAAPTRITRNGATVVMQAVPVDPKAGPVAHWMPAKPEKTVKPAATPVNVAAAVVPAKPVKADKNAKPAALDQIPALRMTADAGKP
jgi:Flp pilus assembly protein TadD